MKQILLFVLISLCAIPSNAQKKLKKQLDSITTTEKAKVFMKSNKDTRSSLMTFNEEKHRTELAKTILRLGKGGSKMYRKEIENIHYKVLEKKSIDYYRVNYIFLDGTQMTIAKIDELRPKIIEMLNAGVPFKDVAQRYSMDMNSKRGGDSGWFKKGDMLPEFEEAVMDNSRAIDDIFTVNVESNKWYYVVQKSHDMKRITEVKVLKVVESKK